MLSTFAVAKTNLDTVYYTSGWKGATKSNAEYYRVASFDNEGQPVGKVKNYFKSGKIQGNVQGASYVSKKDGSKSIWEGSLVRYYESGEFGPKLNYKNDKAEGSGVWYYESGKLQQKLNYKNGKQEGLQTWYYKSGEIEQKVNYKNDKKEGLGALYYKSGEIRRISCYQEGLEIEVGQKTHRENPSTFSCK